MDAVAKRIAADGGHAHAAQIDAADCAAVEAYVEAVANDAGGVDIVFNTVGPSPHEYGNGKNAIGLTVDEFMTPLTTIVKSQFVTARAAARRMTAQRSGVILFLTGSPARGHVEGRDSHRRRIRRSRVADRKPCCRSQPGRRPGYLSSHDRQR